MGLHCQTPQAYPLSRIRRWIDEKFGLAFPSSSLTQSFGSYWGRIVVLTM